MTKLDWTKAKKPKETESIDGDIYIPQPPRRRPSKASLRALADKALAEFNRHKRKGART